jgi:hypothetical protein
MQLQEIRVVKFALMRMAPQHELLKDEKEEDARGDGKSHGLPVRRACALEGLGQ